jgi:hypothetical protein
MVVTTAEPVHQRYALAESAWWLGEIDQGRRRTLIARRSSIAV